MRIARLSALLAMSFFASNLVAEPVRQKLLTVGDGGELNSTNAVATQADLAAIAASNQIAAAEQEAAREGFNQAVSLLSAVATNIAAGTPTVFFGVEISTFDAAVAFDEAKDKVKIVAFEDQNTSSVIGGVLCEKWRMRFAFTADLQTVKPQIGYAQVIDGVPRADWEYLADELVDSPVSESGTYTDGDGNTYDHIYHIDHWLPKENSGFSYVRVPNDAAVADGATIDLPNGVQGGATTVVTWGGKTLTFKGGLLVGVSE